MIFEVARFAIKDGQEAAFEDGVRKAIPLFKAAKGCRSMKLERSIEQPSAFRLIVGWNSVEDHMVGFRESADFQVWRTLVGDYFAQTPDVEHVRTVVEGF